MMARSAQWWGMAVLAITVGGCASFNVSLFPPLSPLQETVIEGEGKPKLLLMEISGVMSEKERGGRLKERPSMVAEVREALLKAEQDEDIAGVIVRINSPGGTVTASDIIHHELQAFRERRKVPVHACIMGIGASGGYYVATAADEISALPTAVTGSIGVLLLRFQVEGLLGKIGVMERTVKSGEKKDMLSPFRPATPEEETIVQEVIDRLHSRFVDVVQARPGNKLARRELETLADGRIYTAAQALEAKLIDRIGYLEDAVAAMKKAAGVEKARVVIYTRRGSYRGSIYAGEAGSGGLAVGPIGFSGDGLEMLTDSAFMYLWKP